MDNTKEIKELIEKQLEALNKSMGQMKLYEEFVRDWKQKYEYFNDMLSKINKIS